MTFVRDESLATISDLLEASSGLGVDYHERLTRFADSLASVVELAHRTIRIHSKVDQDCEQDILALWTLSNALTRLKN